MKIENHIRTGYETAVWISLPKETWPLNSAELNSLDYCVWGG